MSKIKLTHSPKLLGIISGACGRSLELKSISSYGLSKWDLNTGLKTVSRIEEIEVHQQQLEQLGLQHAEDAAVDKVVDKVSPAAKEVNRVLIAHDSAINANVKDIQYIKKIGQSTDKKLDALIALQSPPPKQRGRKTKSPK
jgi:hypothetical protein|tara:strand:+ start:310 stop:732 length:423 start_codon:yes stop_codon:yes gene_type:complete